MDADGATVRAARARLGLSQQQLAMRLGVYQATVSDWECGRKGIRHPRVLALALWALEHGAGDEPPPPHAPHLADSTAEVVVASGARRPGDP